MAEKYLDYSGVQTLWNAVKDRDDQIAAGKAGYIAYNSDNKTIELWASENAYNTRNDGKEPILPISTIDAAPFIKDGMLEDVKIVPASEEGTIYYKGTPYSDPDDLFIKFKWNVDGGAKTDYILLTDIAPVYTAGEGIDVTTNKISFKSGKSDQIKTTSTIKLGGTKLGDLLKEAIPEIEGGTTLQSVLIQLLSKVSWPTNPKRTISALSVSNPEPTVKFYSTSNCNSGAGTEVEVGTDVYLMIKGSSASASASISYSGFDHGYSTVADTDPAFSTAKKTGNPGSITISGNEVSGGVYSISVTKNTTGETIPELTSKANAADVTLSSPIKYTVKDGSVSVTASQTCPNFTGSYTSSQVPKYYALSTLESTSEDHIVEAGTGNTLTGNGKTTSKTATITGYRNLFYGSDESNDPSIFTSDYIRSAAGGNRAKAAIGNYKPSAAGKKMVWIAFPETYNWKVTGAYLPPYTSNNFASKFVSTTVSVNGLNNKYPTNYTVLYAAYDLAFSEADVKITLE